MAQNKIEKEAQKWKFVGVSARLGYRVIDNYRHLLQQQTTGERIPEELKRTQKDIAREAECDVHTEEVLPKKSSVLILTAMVHDGTFGSNTRLLMTCPTFRSI